MRCVILIKTFGAKTSKLDDVGYREMSVGARRRLSQVEYIS